MQSWTNDENVLKITIDVQDLILSDMSKISCKSLF